MRAKVFLLFTFMVLIGVLWTGLVSGQEETTESAQNDVVQATSSEQSEAEEAFFGETMEVTVVNVDVFVTDKKGNRISGLTRDDFEILEDKRPVTITNFFAVDNGEVKAGAVKMEPRPEQVVPGLEIQPRWEVPEEQRLYLIIYIDNFNIRPFNRNRVFRRLREFLATQLSEQDRVMLVSYDRSLHVRQPFTTDPGRISSALYELETMTAYGVNYDSERRDLLREIDESDNAASMSSRIRQYAEGRMNDLTFTLSALRDFTDSLAGLPGRKAILYVSDGLPMVVGQDMFHAGQRKFDDTSMITESFNYDAARRFQELASRANSNRITFYTVDAAGLRTYSSASAENRGSSTDGLDSAVDSIAISNLQSTILYMADTTGGLAIVNSNNPTAGLNRMADDFRSYYSLGYSPSHLGDGRYHRIKVEVKGQKGLNVRYRDGYRDKPLRTRMQDATTSTLMYGFDNNPLGIDLKFGDPTLRDDGNYDMPLEILIPIGRITLVPREEQHLGRLHMYISALDSEGGISPVQEMPLPIEIASEDIEQARQSLFHYQIRLMMRGGSQQVAIGVRDELSSEVSFIRRGTNVGR